MFKSQIQKPTLLIDEATVRRNIMKIAVKLKASGIDFRPHFKTHQSIVIGSWFREEGITKITVSSADMALYFMGGHWEDITIAFPANIREFHKYNFIAERISLHLLVEDIVKLRFLLKKLTHPVNFWIEIDSGEKRSGIDSASNDEIITLISLIQNSGKHRFAGLLNHTGNTYQENSEAEIKRIFESAKQKMVSLSEIIRDRIGTETGISMGDTPSATHIESFEKITELRPGNFVFYDLMQWSSGVCSADEIGVAVAAPVISDYTDRSEALIYCGSVHLSKEYIVHEGRKIFGIPVILKQDKWVHFPCSAYLKSISQEHGLLHFNGDCRLKPGDIIGILPVHSCLTVDMYHEYLSLEGKRIKKFQSLTN